MKKSKLKSTNLKYEDTPVTKVVQKNKIKIIERATPKLRSYRFSVATLEAIEELANKVNKILPFELSRTKIIEKLISEANKDLTNTIKLFTATQTLDS